METNSSTSDFLTFFTSTTSRTHARSGATSKPAVADDLEHLRDELLDIAKLELAVHGLVQILLALLVKLDDLGKTLSFQAVSARGRSRIAMERTV